MIKIKWGNPNGNAQNVLYEVVLYISILRQLLSSNLYYIYIESMLDETKTTTTTLLIGYCVRV